jgi:hypothetical protein
LLPSFKEEENEEEANDKTTSLKQNILNEFYGLVIFSIHKLVIVTFYKLFKSVVF